MSLPQTDIEQMKVFFEPRSVAVVGASRTPTKFGSMILSNLLNLEYDGKIFPVNHNAAEIKGLKCYPSVKEIPEDVELVIIAVPSFAVPDVVRDCEKKAVKGLVIITSGFSEAGEEGIKLQQEVLNIATRAGIRTVGPNTTGTLDSYSKFTTTFIDLKELRKGSVAFIAQTGLFAGVLLHRILSCENFGISKVVGLGNKCDVAEHEILEYLALDVNTKVIMIYLEGVKDGRRFFEVAREVTKKKPVIILKGGRTEQGARAALSHTASLAGRREIFDAVIKQTAMISADDFEELTDFAKMFAYQPLPCGNRVAIVTATGAAGVVAADACPQAGLTLAELHYETLQKVQRPMPAWAKAGHPLDIEPLIERVSREQSYEIGLEAALGDKSVDCCLLIMAAVGMEKIGHDYLVAIRKAHPQKPVSMCIIGGKEIYEQLFQILEETMLPVFPSVRRAVNSLAALYKYKQLISETQI